MIKRNNSPPNQGMLRRPRLNAFIRDGLRHPLLVMLAGPGYGKTKAMASYLAESGENSLWLRLTELDNLSSRFWNHLIEAFKTEYPELSQSLYSLGFPDTLSSFDAFTRILVDNYTEPRRLILVFDDFGVINNERIKIFFRRLVDLELEQFPLVLISSQLTSTDSIAFLSNKRFLVLGRDLRFTPSEISGLYDLYGLTLAPDELKNIEQHTEGWALALHLLVQEDNRAPNTRLLNEIAITHMFEERFFSAYSKKHQLMLVRLALLNHFTKELAIDLYDGNPVELEPLANHPFFTNEPGTGRLFWHHLYHLFLQKKQYLLTEEDKQRSWKIAAGHYAASGDVLESITSYHQSGDHINMLKALSVFAKKLRSVLEKDAKFILEHLDFLTPGEVNEYPFADYLRAHVYMNILELDKAETLLINLAKRLPDRGRPDEAALLGDTYVALGFIHMMRNQEDYGELFQIADGYLPEGSSFYDHNTLAIENNSCFALADNLPGARERMELAAYKGAPWINKVLRGCMSGMEHIISAESAFMVCDFEKARQQAYKGIYKAEANGQHDYAFNGYFVLARIGWLRGDLSEMTHPVQSLVEYSSKYTIAALEEFRDTVLAWYYLLLGDINRVPRSILTMDYLNRTLPSYGRAQIAYACYLASQNEWAKFVAMLEHPRGLFLSKGIFQDRICLFIILAVGHYRLGNLDAAFRALWTAYDMCHHNKLTALFIEAGDVLLPLVSLSRQQRAYDFSQAWLDHIYEEVKNFSGRAEAVRAEYRNLNPVRKTTADNPLSKRERAVLQALSQGLTREEIAHKQYISVNTVKAVIRSIYTKLNAGNRAEAVSIAIAHDYIIGYMPEK